MTATPTPDDGAALCCPLCGKPADTVDIPSDTLCGCFECQIEPQVPLKTWNTRSPAPVSGEAGERAAEAVHRIYEAFLPATHDRNGWKQTVAKVIRQHCAGAGREGLPALTKEP